MRLSTLSAAALLAIICAGVFLNYGNAQQEDSLTDAQRDEINTMIRQYILNNPEIIPEAVEVLRARQNANALMQSQDLLYNDGYSYVAGNEDGDITIVEFYDYNCGYCKQVPEVLSRLMDEDSNLKVIFKELPILAESSEFASFAAMASMKQGKFLDFHRALMKNKRALDEDLILQIARDSGIDEKQLVADMANPEIEANIMKTKYLVQNIGISGTPGFVIGGRIIPGYVPYEKLKEIIKQERETRQM